MIKNLVIQALVIFFIIMAIDYLQNMFDFMKKIPSKIFLILALIFYIGMSKLLKIQENFEGEEQIEEVNMAEMEEEPAMEEESTMEEEPAMEEESTMEEEPAMEEKPKTNTELSAEIPNQMEEKPEEKVSEEIEKSEEEINQLTKKEAEPKEDLKKIQDKYIIMPVESWIKNDINLMKEKQTAESCSCPTVLDGSFASY